MPNEIGKWTRAQLRRFIVLVSGAVEGSGGGGGWTDEDDNIVRLSTATDKVGIGTTSPKTSLVDVQDYSTTTFENQLSAAEGGGHIIKYGTGTTVAGQLYFLHTDGSWDSTDANVVASGASQLLGVALGTSPTTHGILLRGYVRIASSMVNGTAAIGSPVYVSDTASEYDFTAPSSSGDFIRVMGYCIDTHSSDILLYLNPDPTWVEVT